MSEKVLIMQPYIFSNWFDYKRDGFPVRQLILTEIIF